MNAVFPRSACITRWRRVTLLVCDATRVMCAAGAGVARRWWRGGSDGQKSMWLRQAAWARLSAKTEGPAWNYFSPNYITASDGWAHWMAGWLSDCLSSNLAVCRTSNFRQCVGVHDCPVCSLSRFLLLRASSLSCTTTTPNRRNMHLKAGFHCYGTLNMRNTLLQPFTIEHTL